MVFGIILCKLLMLLNIIFSSLYFLNFNIECFAKFFIGLLLICCSYCCDLRYTQQITIILLTIFYGLYLTKIKLCQKLTQEKIKKILHLINIYFCIVTFSIF